MTQPLNIADSNFRLDHSLRLEEDEVQLWRIDLEAIGSDESRWQEILSLDERTRASRYHFARDRRHFAAARACLRIILANFLGMETSDLVFQYSKKEKPSLSSALPKYDITFNVSHSGGAALLAFTRKREIGVDIEKLRDDFDLEAIARRFFSAREQAELFALPGDERVEAFFRCWTRKEAYIKATGDGLSLPLSQFDVSLKPAENDALLCTRPDASEARSWILQEVPAGPGYAAALCVRGRDWKLNSWS